jgi:uncharacterized protein YaaW (UPF0174 family)
MDYIADDNLSFLKDVESRKLKRLSDILLVDVDGKLRPTVFKESIDLLRKKEDDREIKNWQIFAKEIQCFGGNSLANAVRRKGVEYEKIVDDVVDKMELSDSLKLKNVEEKEQAIIDELKKTLILKDWSNLASVCKKFARNISEKLAAAAGILGNMAKQSLLKEKMERFSLDMLQYDLRKHYDSSSDMEGLLQDAGADRKNLLFKLVNFVLDNPAQPLKVFNPNWSVTVQSIVEISRLRKSTQGLSIAFLGATCSGKSTLLNYLQTGNFVSLDKGTSGVESYSSFYSPLVKKRIKNGSDVSGGSFYMDEQKALCQNKDLVFFCFNPKEIVESVEKKNDFLSRLGMLKDTEESRRILFIATHCDTYSKEEMKQKMYEMIHSKDMGNVADNLNIDNSYYVNLKDETQTKEMFGYIKEKYMWEKK